MNSSKTLIDPYHILCLEPGATLDDAKAAFRRMAKQFHPDVNKDSRASEQFQLVTQAFDMIKGGYKPPKRRWSSSTSAYKVYEIIPKFARSVVIHRSETVFHPGTVFHIMRGDDMFKFRLDERKRLPFDVTVKGVVLKFRNPV